MTPTTAAIAIAVVSADMSISQRARATKPDVSAAVASAELPDRLSTTVTMTQQSVLIAEQEQGERLDRVLAARIAELSRSRLKALIEAGAVAIDGRTIRDPSHRVNSGS